MARIDTRIGKLEKQIVNLKPVFVPMENYQQNFEMPGIVSSENLATINDKLINDALYRLSVTNYINSKLDIATGYKTSIKKVFTELFNRAFLLTCSWVPVNGFTPLKETEIIKLIIECGSIMFPQTPPSMINDAMVNYLNSLKRNTKSKQKKSA